MPSAPTIAVAIPVYNGARHIGAAVRSLVGQTYPHWRLCVHDNASTDNTRLAVESFQDPRIQLIHHRRHAPMHESWQRCLDDVRGDFLQLLCADDCLHPACFETKVREAAKPENRDIALFTSNRMLITGGGRRLFPQGYAKTAASATLAEVLRGVAGRTNPIGDPGAVLIRTEILRKETRAFCGQLTMDIDFWLRLLEHGNLRHLPQTLSYFRLGGTTGRHFGKDWREYFSFYRTAVRRRLPVAPWWYYAGYPAAAGRFVLRKMAYAVAG
ncbi:MAG: glycosyltransferase family 2 protein [Gammaproteobacteria bacterium]